MGLRKKILNLSLAILIATLEPLQAFAEDYAAPSNSDAGVAEATNEQARLQRLSHLQFESEVLESTDGQMNVAFARGVATSEELADILAEIPEAQDALVSTDSEEVVQQFENEVMHESPRATGLRFIVPIGHLKKARDHIFTTPIKKSKIGFTITLFSTGYACFVWLHATKYSPEVRDLSAIYTILQTLAYGFNRDLWNRVSSRLQRRFINLLRFARMPTWALGSLTYFSAHFLMTTAVQTGRAEILNIGQLQPSVVFTTAGIAALLGLASTVQDAAVTFFKARVGDRRNPFASMVINAADNMRTTVLGLVASSAMLVQPEAFGFTPEIAIATSGVLGIAAILRGDRFVEWLESSQALNAVRRRTLAAADAIDRSFVWMKNFGARVFFRRSSCPEVISTPQSTD